MLYFMSTVLAAFVRVHLAPKGRWLGIGFNSPPESRSGAGSAQAVYCAPPSPFASALGFGRRLARLLRWRVGKSQRLSAHNSCMLLSSPKEAPMFRDLLKKERLQLWLAPEIPGAAEASWQAATSGARTDEPATMSALRENVSSTWPNPRDVLTTARVASGM